MSKEQEIATILRKAYLLGRTDEKAGKFVVLLKWDSDIKAIQALYAPKPVSIEDIVEHSIDTLGKPTPQTDLDSGNVGEPYQSCTRICEGTCDEYEAIKSLLSPADTKSILMSKGMSEAEATEFEDKIAIGLEQCKRGDVRPWSEICEELGLTEKYKPTPQTDLDEAMTLWEKIYYIDKHAGGWDECNDCSIKGDCCHCVATKVEAAIKATGYVLIDDKAIERVAKELCNYVIVTPKEPVKITEELAKDLAKAIANKLRSK